MDFTFAVNLSAKLGIKPQVLAVSGIRNRLLAQEFVSFFTKHLDSSELAQSKVRDALSGRDEQTRGIWQPYLDDVGTMHVPSSIALFQPELLSADEMPSPVSVHSLKTEAKPPGAFDIFHPIVSGITDSLMCDLRMISLDATDYFSSEITANITREVNFGIGAVRWRISEIKSVAIPAEYEGEHSFSMRTAIDSIPKDPSHLALARLDAWSLMASLDLHQPSLILPLEVVHAGQL